MANINDIAQMAGVSKSTVSKAMNGGTDVSETVRNKILMAAEEMGYLKHKGQNIAILIRNTAYQQEGDFGFSLIRGFKEMYQDTKISRTHVIIEEIEESLEKEMKFDEFMARNKYVACFVIGFSYHDIWLSQIQQSNYPSVLYDNEARGIATTAQVGVDNEEAMSSIVSHLVGLGHQKIAYLSGELGSYYSKQRYAAFLKAIAEHDLSFEENMFGAAYFVSDCVSQHLPRMLQEGATALVCGHDSIANTAMNHCKEMGFSVPDQVSVVGFDDIKLASFTSPPLTTIKQDCLQIGKSAFFALEGLRNSIPVNVVYLHSELIVRNSTATARKR
ncbi:MAG: LacI family DNA-binding transcriptional regulator [Eubacteriales bacterium]